MKKSIILLAMGIAMMFTTSCRWIHETFYSIEGCVEWYCEEIYEAAADNDKKAFIERCDQLENWLDGLSKSDNRKAQDALDDWCDRHERMCDFVDAYGESLF